MSTFNTINKSKLSAPLQKEVEQHWANNEWVMIKGKKIIHGSDDFERHEYKNEFLLVVAHGGANRGQGRHSSIYPVFTKKFRASESERIEFLSLLTGDARKDFEIVFQAVRASSLANTACS